MNINYLLEIKPLCFLLFVGLENKMRLELSREILNLPPYNRMEISLHQLKNVLSTFTPPTF